MKPGLFGQQLTLMEELKATTFASHARMQTAPWFQALAACQLPLESYVGQLRALLAIHGVVEQALNRSDDARVAAVRCDGVSRLLLLQQDLEYFEPRAVADINEERYGARGRRFARSDAAWQATLCRYPAAQILQQVRWLGRVLAGRGMPTLLLQVQLEILVDELTMATPGKKPEYDKLLPAAAALHSARRAHLADERIEAMADAFDRVAGAECSARLPRTGVLLCTAVADEMNGNENAVESLRGWLTDASQFSPNWISAVEGTLAEARRQVGAVAGQPS